MSRPSVMPMSEVEVLAVQRRRRYSAEEKQRMVQETYLRWPGSDGHGRLEEFQSILSFSQTQQESYIRGENDASACCKTPRCIRVLRLPPLPV